MEKRLKSIAALILALVLAATPVMAFEYEVKEGDVLWKIADDLGVDLNTLQHNNNISNPNLIYPGQTLSTTASMTSNTSGAEAKYIFLFIGDGLGASQRQISEFFKQTVSGDKSDELLMNTFPVAGINTTYSADSYITDSAAAGTALSSGVKTNNGVVGMDAAGKDVVTLVEAAEAAGMATGLATTTRLTHATPASFAAHEPSRGNANEIAEDYLVSGVDYFAGGGIRHFIPQDMTGTDAKGGSFKSKRKDDRNLVDEFAALGYETYLGMDGATAFRSADLASQDKVFAAFTYSHMPYEVDRINSYPDCPSLAELTAGGIEVLSKDEDGFFFMIEGGRIDHASHANDAAGAVHDTLAFDDAVAEAYEFYMDHPEETLILVVGDHETGGMGLGMDTQGYFINMAALTDVKVSVEDDLMWGDGAYTGDQAAYTAYIVENLGLGSLTADEAAKLNKGMADADAGITYGYYEYNSAAMAATQIVSERANVNWTTTIHTATAIPMSAIGNGAENFGGYKDNTEIAKTLADFLGFKLSK